MVIELPYFLCLRLFHWGMTSGMLITAIWSIYSLWLCTTLTISYGQQCIFNPQINSLSPKYSFLNCVISHVCLFDVRDLTNLFIELVRLDRWHTDEQWQEVPDIQTNSTSHNQRQMNTHWEKYIRERERVRMENKMDHSILKSSFFYLVFLPLIFKINSVLYNRWHVNVLVWFLVQGMTGHGMSHYSLYNGRVQCLSAQQPWKWHTGYQQ